MGQGKEPVVFIVNQDTCRFVV